MMHKGNYRDRVMPFSLKNAGATYQRMMHKVCKSQIGLMLEAYMNDMIVKSKTNVDHTVDLKKVLAAL